MTELSMFRSNGTLLPINVFMNMNPIEGMGTLDNPYIPVYNNIYGSFASFEREDRGKTTYSSHIARTMYKGQYFIASMEDFATVESEIAAMITGLADWTPKLIKQNALNYFLHNTILDQDYAGGYGGVMVAGNLLYYNIPKIAVDHLSESIILGERYISVRISDTWLNKLANCLDDSSLTSYQIKKRDAYGHPGFYYAEQFRDMHHSLIVDKVKGTLLKAPSGELGLMWAWTHFSNVPYGAVGFDAYSRGAKKLTVVEEWVQGTLNIAAVRKLITAEERKLIWQCVRRCPGIINGVRVMGIRHPVTSANGDMRMPIVAVNAHSRMVGVSLRTAKDMLGDFDHDLFFATYLPGDSSESLASAIEVLRRNTKQYLLSGIVLPAGK